MPAVLCTRDGAGEQAGVTELYVKTLIREERDGEAHAGLAEVQGARCT